MHTDVAPPSTDADADADSTAGISTATLALPSTAPAPRRLPPPCWAPDETSALIDAYRDKWYSLRRGNLRANHWQDVAADVASRCPASPPKTAVQCRHKMEKLRKRYRAEIQRAAAHGGHRRHASSWAHFLQMHAMERGPNPSPPSSSSSDEGDQKNSSIKRINDLYSHHPNRDISGEGNGSAGIRIKIPGRVNPEISMVPNPTNPYNPRFANFVPGNLNRADSNKFPHTQRRARENQNTDRAGSALGELVAAIHELGEGFMRMEKVKMDMARQLEETRMEMELKRTQMILKSEQRILEHFANAISESSSKRAKRDSQDANNC